MAAAQPASREGAGPQSHGQSHRPTARRGGDGDGGQVGRGGQQQGTGGQNEEAFLPSLLHLTLISLPAATLSIAQNALPTNGGGGGGHGQLIPVEKKAAA